ncbi:hypothetical protein [Tepidimonas alkaliphilus]|uniref:hypothetical protein n=1 Tax=Tepidimonas alkaliphilus TaxID=2588942 RepID=UPI00163D6ABD|nr:hypothetical protein [Tepidimonas alkaliphilus]
MGLYDRDYYHQHRQRVERETSRPRRSIGVGSIVLLTLVICAAVYGIVRLVADVAPMLR